MPRQARIDAPGALHHIIARGIEKQPIFHDDTDRNNILDRLGNVLEETQTPCYAWAMMPNHVHLLLRTGQKPISQLMRCLLTGHAVYFNRRHKRHGHLFQNRYKSILCQEDAYLLELVRYIHLNPLRARIVGDLKELVRYPFCGHGTLTGKSNHPWQDVNYVLRFFDEKKSLAKKRYVQFVEKGISLGRRPELTGGGLIRSAGGWAAVIGMRSANVRVASDERILGDGDFVETVLKAAKEKMDRQYLLKATGFDLDAVMRRVAQLLELSQNDLRERSRRPRIVQARDLICYWGYAELGISMTELSKKFGLSQPAVSLAVRRGEKIVKKNQYTLTDT